MNSQLTYPIPPITTGLKTLETKVDKHPLQERCAETATIHSEGLLCGWSKFDRLVSGGLEGCMFAWQMTSGVPWRRRLCRIEPEHGRGAGADAKNLAIHVGILDK